MIIVANARKEFMVHTNFNCHNEKKQRRSERAKKEGALFQLYVEMLERFKFRF